MTVERGALRLQVDVSAGELLDKISILAIKERRIDDARALGNVRRELRALRAVRDRHVTLDPTLSGHVQRLDAVNLALWDIEDRIRAHEGRRDFGPAFVELARSVYCTNDERARIKQAIDAHLGAWIREEKSYC